MAHRQAPSAAAIVAGTASSVQAPPVEPPARINVVNLDGLALLKIIKHCREGYPQMVTGSLLGLDSSEVLEVSNCFPFLPETPDEVTGKEYQIEMMTSLRVVNVDNNVVGWYQSTVFGSYCDKDFIANQFRYHSTFGYNAVVIIHDPVRSSKGNLALRALRLTDEFVAAYEKNNRFPLATFLQGCPLPPSRIFEEVPIKIHNPHLIRGLLFEWEEKKEMDCEFDRLDLTSNPVLEKNMQNLVYQVEELASMQNQTQFWERKLSKQAADKAAWLARRRDENDHRIAAGQEPLPEEDLTQPFFRPLPAEAASIDRLDALLTAARINMYCEDMKKFAGQSFSKLFLAGMLHQKA